MSSLSNLFIPTPLFRQHHTPFPTQKPRRDAILCSQGNLDINGQLKLSDFQLAKTPITPIQFRGRTVYIKRDDLLNFAGIKGSKLRKFYSLFKQNEDIDYDCLVSYGGSQSNAMLALAYLCKYYRKRFLYITRPTPERLSSSPGNLREALGVGMEHVQVSLETFRACFTDAPREIRKTACSVLRNAGYDVPSAKLLFVPQGGAWTGAELGIRVLASEVCDQIHILRRQGLLAPRKPILFIPSGTGTTAFYLQQHLHPHAQVVTVPVSGDERYLIKQMRWLDSYDSDEKEQKMKTTMFPDILRPRLRSTFADVRPEKLAIWKELSRSTGGDFEFDLVYAPKTWEEVMLAIDEGRLGSRGEDLIYYHSGGAEGNVSMLGKIKTSR